MRLLATSGMLGYGFTEQAFQRAVTTGIDVIGCDGGSMDPGPYYLGSGEAFVSARAARRDLSLMLRAGIAQRIPVIVGSAGGAGGAPHVAATRALVEDIAREHGLSFTMAVIHAEQSTDDLIRAITEGRVQSLGPINDLSVDEARRARRVVAMMGVEPIQAALADGAQVVIAGRASDAAIYASRPLMDGYDPGLAWHLGKIIECAGQVVEPRSGQDCVIGALSGEHFLVEPGHPDKRCTRMRIAAHTLYENPSPYELHEPGGVLDTRAARYEQVDARTVKVAGSQFTATTPYTVKLEGVEAIGFRSVFIAGARDPGLVASIDEFVARCRERVAGEANSLGIDENDYTLTVRLYGRNAVMGEREPVSRFESPEVGIVADVIASDEEISRAVLAKARYALLHTDFPHRKCISGNLAIPFSPSDLSAGPVFRFSVWHTMAIADPLAPFPIEMISVRPTQ